MIPGLVWYQPICSSDYAEDVSYYVTCFSATTFVDERRSSVLSDQATVIFDVEFDVQLVLSWQIFSRSYFLSCLVLLHPR